jgi:hypothetical protein
MLTYCYWRRLGAELLEPSEGVTPTLELKEAKPITTLDLRPRPSENALPPKPGVSPLAQVAEQFSSSYRQMPLMLDRRGLFYRRK